MATPLIELFPHVLAKFECDNPGGSHKVRAARAVVKDGFDNGRIIPGHTTVIEKTGGNFGFGLAVACRELAVPVELVVGLSFSAVKRKCLEKFGAKLIGLEMLNQGSTPREVVEWHLLHARELDKHYYYTDQFNNLANLQAYELETGPEIAMQLRANFPNIHSLTFVACAGTGASITGINRALNNAGYETNVVLVEPEGCDSRQGKFIDHKFEGMSVGVSPPFIEWEKINQVRTVNHEDMIKIQSEIARNTGYLVGNTSAACLKVALSLPKLDTKEHYILSVIYDDGLWYIH